MPTRPRFDRSKPMVAARDFTFMGKPYQAGDQFGPFDDSIHSRPLARQYETRAVNHTDEAPAAEQDGEPVQMTGPKGGRYTITAPWLADPEVVRGLAAAKARVAELKAEGAPLGFIDGGSAVTVEGGEGGWYKVNAPWLAEPEKLQGREGAEARQRELHDAGEPDSHSGYTLTEGENGWWKITKDGVETDPPAVLNVQGEDKAREDVATLRAGKLIEGAALPAEWTEQQGQPDVDAPGTQAPEDTTVKPDEDKPLGGDKPNEPGTNQPNGAEVINDQKRADEQTDEGDGTARPVGP